VNVINEDGVSVTIKVAVKQLRYIPVGVNYPGYRGPPVTAQNSWILRHTAGGPYNPCQEVTLPL
jgi:hypothetical protein